MSRYSASRKRKKATLAADIRICKRKSRSRSSFKRCVLSRQRRRLEIKLRAMRRRGFIE